jgi:hypothetical protein
VERGPLFIPKDGTALPGRKLLPALLCLAWLPLCGCADDAPPAPPPARACAEHAGSSFDPSTAGTVQGQVTWTGECPIIAPMRGWTDVAPDSSAAQRHVEPNPNAPSIDPVTRGIANAVVFLRGVDPQCGRPWDLPRVQVEQRGYQLLVHQADAVGRDGFVRLGDDVEMISTGPVFHLLRAAGAASFSLAFPDPDRPRTRTLSHAGIVELTSAAGYFWMRAYLFVDDHPYYSRTDGQGHFTLPQVPPGCHEVVCWLPDWHEASHDRDPETSLVMRLKFRPPVEHVQTVNVMPAGTQTIQFAWKLSDF